MGTDYQVHVRWPGTVTLRGRHGKRRTYPNTENYRTAIAEHAREIARRHAGGDTTFVRVTSPEGQVWCWTPDRGWWEKRG